MVQWSLGSGSRSYWVWCIGYWVFYKGLVGNVLCVLGILIEVIGHCFMGFRSWLLNNVLRGYCVLCYRLFGVVL